MVNSVLPVAQVGAPVLPTAAEGSAGGGDSPTTSPAPGSAKEDSEVDGVEAAAAAAAKAAQSSAFIDGNKKAEEFRNYGQDSPRYNIVRAFYEEQHEKQTYEFATTMREKYTTTTRCTLTAWEALMCVRRCPRLQRRW
jgi:hypothetical protein